VLGAAAGRALAVGHGPHRLVGGTAPGWPGAGAARAWGLGPQTRAPAGDFYRGDAPPGVRPWSQGPNRL